MHIGLACPELSGHLNPMTALGQELQARGHRITMIARPDAEATCRAAGLEFSPIGIKEFPLGAMAEFRERLGKMSTTQALGFTVRFLQKSAEVSLRDTPGIISSLGIEGLLIDQLTPAPCSVAEVMNLPFVHACNALALDLNPDFPPGIFPWRYRPGRIGRLRNRLGNALLTWISQPVTRTINNYRKGHGLPPKSPRSKTTFLAAVAQQPAFFDYPTSFSQPRFFYTAPWHREGARTAIPFPWHALNGKPLVYASLGTLQNRIAEYFVMMAAAVESMDVQLVISLGGSQQDPAELARQCPGNPLVVAEAPQLEVLRRASLVITHAGLNTALESLSHGLPMVAIPITNDQPGVARRLEWLGVAEVIAPSKLTVPRLRTAVERVLATPTYRARARELQAKMASIDGLSLAADITLAALQTHSPVTQWPLR